MFHGAHLQLVKKHFGNRLFESDWCQRGLANNDLSLLGIRQQVPDIHDSEREKERERVHPVRWFSLTDTAIVS